MIGCWQESPYGEFADVIAPYLGMTVNELNPLLTKPNTRFVYLKKKVPAMTYSRMAAALAERNLYGIFRENDPIRTYPTGTLAGSIVGFVNPDGVGVEELSRWICGMRCLGPSAGCAMIWAYTS